VRDALEFLAERRESWPCRPGRPRRRSAGLAGPVTGRAAADRRTARARSAGRQLLPPLAHLRPAPVLQGDFYAARAELTLALAGHRTVPASATCAYARQALIAAAEYRFAAAWAAVQAGLGWCAGTDGPTQIIRMCLTAITIEAERADATAAGKRLGGAAAAAGTAATLIHRARSAATSGTATCMHIVQAELATAEAEWSRLHDGHGGSAARSGSGYDSASWDFGAAGFQLSWRAARDG